MSISLKSLDTRVTKLENSKIGFPEWKNAVPVTIPSSGYTPPSYGWMIYKMQTPYGSSIYINGTLIDGTYAAPGRNDDSSSCTFPVTPNDRITKSGYDRYFCWFIPINLYYKFIDMLRRWF